MKNQKLKNKTTCLKLSTSQFFRRHAIVQCAYCVPMCDQVWQLARSVDSASVLKIWICQRGSGRGHSTVRQRRSGNGSNHLRDKSDADHNFSERQPTRFSQCNNASRFSGERSAAKAIPSSFREKCKAPRALSFVPLCESIDTVWLSNF